MGHDKIERIAALDDRREAYERELRQSLEQKVHRLAERDAAITLATRVAMIGSIPSILWSIASRIQSGWTGNMEIIIGPLCFVIPFVIIAAAAGVISGFIAAWWFSGSPVRVLIAAISMAVLSDAVLFLWVVTLMQMKL